MLARPISDDLMVINYLQMKYKINMQTDVESAAIDLIVGSFDLLAFAKARREPDLVMFAMKSFLINKVPIIVSNLAASMYSHDRTEYCIVQAMSHVDPTLFPSASFGMVNQSAFQDVRQQFLFSCVLHSLLRRESVDSLLGEAPFRPPPEPSSRLVKEDLYQQCAADSERITELVEQLEKLDGNARAISAAMQQVSGLPYPARTDACSCCTSFAIAEIQWP
jgi:mediator of RNA polymerase II transcription subunit 5